ncbi:substrate-binding domain-containing protein [Calothrix sp. PCC 6303]|uniref:substrate-binding domain-containing protein n=1 Tax=Calothrix sp. PCC 6303 TaxID=1170562 RepID=UPI0002A04AE1|nr:substrate-binding domain-containing protein [Calothrix sp. PCC 6303]AFZ01042.1 putative phosphate transport system substrate-binding protein [Calothrix sp. PCC 6303]
MWQKEKKYSSIVSIAFLLTLASQPLVTTFFFSPLVVAQSPSPEPSFPLPKAVPTGTTVNIDGSSSMARINDNLKQKYEQQYPGTKVNITTNGTNAALKTLLDGKNVDIAAIGRGLTPQEQSKGLEQFRLRREKIGIVVGEKNPFKGNLTNQQFAKIFRGEITDWSQLGGAKGKIRFIDRPNDSDTREALRNYPSFQSAKFATGANATQLKQDDTALLVKQLGKDGIGYAIANQISQVPGLRVLKLHQTLPDNPKYPFSQPLVYVFKKNPTAPVASFLGFAGAEPGKIAVEAARTAEATAVAQTVAQAPAQAPATTATPGVTVSPTTEAVTNTNTTTSTTVTSPDGGTTTTVTNNGNQAFVQGTSETAAGGSETTPFPLWWLALPVAALGLLWWLIGGKGKKEKEPQQTIAPATTLPIQGATNTVLPVGERELTTSNSDLSGAVLGTTAAIAGGAAGVSLWSRLGNPVTEDSNHDIESVTTNNTEINTEISSDLEEPAAVVMPYTGLTGMPQGDSVDTLNADIPNVEISPVDDLPPGHSNLLDNVDLSSSGVDALAAGAGAGLLSRFANTDDQQTNQNQEIQDTTKAEATPPTSTNYVSEVLPDVWDDSQTNNSGNISSSEIIVEDDQFPVISEVPEINTVQDTNLLAVDEPQPEANWLDNITSTDNTTAAGIAGVAGVAGAGAALWNQFANRDNEQNNPEPIVNPETQVNTWVDNSTESGLDLNTVADAAEFPQDAAALDTEASNIPDFQVNEDPNPIALAGGAAAVAGTGAALLSNFSNSPQTPTVVQTVDTIQPNQPHSQSGNIILTPRTPKWAYASWHVSDAEKEILRQQGGSQMTLRLYDVTGIDLSYQEPQLIQQHECQEVTEDRFVAIPVSDRDYMIELGYLTDDSRWLPLTRSSIVRVFSRPHDEFWFETDAELIIHGATKPGSNVSIAGHPIKLKSDGTFHLRVPFTEELLDYVMKSVAVDGDKDKTVHVRFSQNESQK